MYKRHQEHNLKGGKVANEAWFEQNRCKDMHPKNMFCLKFLLIPKQKLLKVHPNLSMLSYPTSKGNNKTPLKEQQE